MNPTRSGVARRPLAATLWAGQRASTHVVVLFLLLSATLAAIASARVRSGPHAISAGASLVVTGRELGRPVSSSFVGVSIEYPTLPSYAGDDPRAINPVFEELVRNLAPKQRPSLRISGASADRSWWPIPHHTRPAGVSYAITSRWIAVASALSRRLHARLILGLNLEAGDLSLTAGEERALAGGIGRQQIDAFEIGNEPELYTRPYFRRGRRRFSGRSRGWSFPAFEREFSRTAHTIAAVPLAGPDTGSPRWIADLDRFLGDEPRVSLATVHSYPLKRCGSSPVTPNQLLTVGTARGPAEYLARYADVAHRHGARLRVDEMNAVSCGGAPGVSDAFAAALWAPDALFQMARVGIDGVNIHSNPASYGRLFSFRHYHGSWRARVKPEYYGLVLFARAAPPGSRLLKISGASDPALRVWATRAPDGRLRVLVINEGNGADTLGVTIPGATSRAKLERLLAPSVGARAGITLAGQSFGTTTSTGRLSGPIHIEWHRPNAGRYELWLPAASAALLTLPAPGVSAGATALRRDAK